MQSKDLANNPWIEGHVEGETAFHVEHLGPRRARGVANAIVRNEYLAGGDPVKCPTPGCPGTAHYKATIGVHKCPDCGELCHENGDPL